MKKKVFALIAVLLIAGTVVFYVLGNNNPEPPITQSGNVRKSVELSPVSPTTTLSETTPIVPLLNLPTDQEILNAVATAERAARISSPPIDEERLKIYNSLQARIEAVKNGDPSDYASLISSVDYLKHNEQWGYATELGISELADMITTYESGRSPYEKATGFIPRGYISPVDETVQSYVINIPSDYDRSQKYPLVISLHHHGWSDWFRPFQGYNGTGITDALVLSPHGRGSCDYMWVAAEEILTVIAEAKKLYNVDEDRIYMTGYSMGGTGSWYLATRSPHTFAAIVPVAGNADFTAWVKRWNWRLHSESPFAFLRQYLRESTCAAAYAENLRNVAVLCHHGKNDSIVPVEHARGMVEKLQALGYEGVKYEESDAAHASRSESEIWNWMREYKREPYPQKVSLKTNTLRHNRAYYVEMLSRSEPDQYSHLELSWNDMVSVTSSNVQAFAINFSEKMLTKLKYPSSNTFEVDGEKLTANQPKGRLVFRKLNGKWQVNADTKQDEIYENNEKRPHLEGPIEDAFTRPFIIVYGTNPNYPELSRSCKEEAERFVRNWKTRYYKPCKIKPDSEITNEDAKKYNLVVYGTPWNCSILENIHKSLPFKIEKDGITPRKGEEKKITGDGIGIRFVYPNPHNPEKYVVINSSPTIEGFYGIDFRFGNWFDWIPYDNRPWYDFCIFDSHTQSPETFIEVGFFDRTWNFNDKYSWKGVSELRKSATAMEYRKAPAPSDSKEVFLDSFKPVYSQTLKGFFNLNRSWSGAKLRSFGKEYSHGIGIRISSHLAWYTGGAFKRFTADLGIDYGGMPLESISLARIRAEEVGFVIVGDDRTLYEESVDSSSGIKTIDLDITGVKYLSLILKRKSPEGWLYGSATWGNAKLYR